MKASINKETYEKIYDALGKVSPVDFDCGMICGASCCVPEGREENDGEELGMYLLPGEEAVHDMNDSWLSWEVEAASDYDFPKSWDGAVCFVNCNVNPSECHRDKRPIQCRTFPLLPHLDKKKGLCLIYDDSDLPYECPLITNRSELNEDFIEETYKAWEILITDPLIYDLVKMDSDRRPKHVEIIKQS